MTARHPIQDAPPEKQREALEYLLALVGASAGSNGNTVLSPAPWEIDRALREIADTRLPVSREAWERIPHIHACIGDGVYKLNEPRGHRLTGSDLVCASLGGRCGFKPEDEA